MTPGTTHALSCRHRPDSLRLSRQSISTSTPPRCPVQYWYDPMVPEKHFDKPGKSPFMDMLLVPKFGPAAAADCRASEVMPEAMEGTP